MKNIVYCVWILIILLGCSEEGEERLFSFSELIDPIAIDVYCQSSPNELLRRIEYEYSNNSLISETIFANGNLQSKKILEYNSKKQLISEITELNLRKINKSFIYNDLDQLINIKYKITDYDINGQEVAESESEAPLEYENGLLVKDWESWGGFNTYEYENNLIVSKTEYTKAGEKHHITTYKYSDDLLIGEIKETKSGNVLYSKEYFYDTKSRLIQIKDGENTIEENDYDNDKLIEKRTFYFGIDPGFDICLGNYIYKYQY
ncbi:hypothetical protein [Maribacter sp. 4G9]|uniref:hypothetical protein n=1 Tax=Maribacter sp. 4G9 TaxID=1889777 RepID=UPI000C145040|nr:hypothetical protein [Maribacter sp. 4G9]PIB31228.1 hypothetical protein BFP75_00045 [Maribacter sp. 4G9]